jgi:thioredoxin-related protein
MKKSTSVPAGITLVLVLACIACLSQTSVSVAQSKYAPVTKYDPKRDAAADIQNAIEEAQRTHKRILLEVGGEWCSWCHTLDNFFATHKQLLDLREQNFVIVKINYSEENENKQVLSRYGKPESFPYLFVLDSDGKLLLAKETGGLESGPSYNLDRLTAFLTEWSPAGAK